MSHVVKPSLTELWAWEYARKFPTRFGLITTIGSQRFEAKQCAKAGWQPVGKRRNPGTGSLITVWWKSNPRGETATLDRYPTSTWCCGLRLNTKLAELDNRLTIACIGKKHQKTPKGWQHLGSYGHQHYYLNAFPPKEPAQKACSKGATKCKPTRSSPS